MFIPEYLQKEIRKIHPDYFIYFNPVRKKLQIRCWVTPNIFRYCPSLKRFYSIPFFRNSAKYTHEEILKKSLLVKTLDHYKLDNRLIDDLWASYVPEDKVEKVIKMIDKSNEELLEKLEQEDYEIFGQIAKEIRMFALEREPRYSR